MMLAKHYKFLRQFKLSYVINAQPLEKIHCKCIYATYKKQFDALNSLFSKYNLDPVKYIEFFVNVLNKVDSDIKTDLLNIKTINDYIEYLQSVQKKKLIYQYILKTVGNIADECISKNFSGAMQFLKDAISSKKLGEYIISGKISKYFLATIPKFDKIISKLDYFSRCELSDLEELYAVYNTDANEAGLLCANCKIHPYELVDDFIFMKKGNLKTLSCVE